LGGFDLGPAMVAYTGTRIVATELGAWSALAKTIILDVSRRSTSFEHRIRKYAYFCHVILPGLPADTKVDYSDTWKSIQEVHHILEKLISEAGFRFDADIATGETRLIGNDASNYPYDEVEEELQKLANQRGYHITKLKLKSHDLPIKMTKLELLESLHKTALHHGFFLNLEEYEGYHDGLDDRLNLAPSDYSHLQPCIAKISLNLMDIQVLRSEKERWRGYWNIRVRKNPQIEYAVNLETYSDYGSFPVMVTHSSNDPKYNDYSDSQVWPQLMVAGNLSMLLSPHNSQGVVAITCLKKSDTPIGGESEDWHNLVVDAMSRNTRNINGYSTKKIADLIRESFVNPDLGDCDGFF
jgi:hypothetical protein